ncbi:MAG: relaxase/mobilization nuclease domain-containing protein [Caulobacterales bacterium]|uniref:relaxase/mobilization nuclease domain-containing protein n=1 Tax=Glycocaulis sp. TaxID=1969725 RepID=UPI003FA03B12
MILVGNQRGGAKDLAQHLLKPENEHVSVHELRGFAAQSLGGALNEACALSRGSQCQQFLFSLSVNPPLKARVSTEEFIRAIDRAEKQLGLDGQPRAIVFHEKLGRRHAHVVWSRIDADSMKAVPLPFTKRKLMALTRELFIEHGWQMPKGLADPAQRDPRNFTLAEWQ